MRPLALALLSLLLLGGGGSAAAREGARVATSAASPSERVALAVAHVLPAGLAATQVLAPSLPAGDVSVSFAQAPRPGWSSVLALVTQRGREVGRGWVRLELKPVRRVLCTARTVEAGEALEGAAVRVEERPVSSGEGFLVEGDGPSPLSGARAARALPEGALLVESDLSRPAAVPRGTPVRLLVRRGLVTITATAVLERAARPGERTAARLPALGRILQGRLVDAGTFVEEEVAP